MLAPHSTTIPEKGEHHRDPPDEIEKKLQRKILGDPWALKKGSAINVQQPFDILPVERLHTMLFT